MTKSIKLYFVYVLILFGCNHESCPEKDKILTGRNFKYWDIVYFNHDGRIGYSPIGSYRFAISKDCYYLKYYKDDKKRGFFIQEDVINDNTWSLLNKDTI